MEHCVTGLVTRTDKLRTFARQFSLPEPIALTGGLKLLPLRDDDLDAILPVQTGSIGRRLRHTHNARHTHPSRRHALSGLPPA